MSGELYVGVDVGTTASKAVLVDSYGTVVARGRTAHPASPLPGRVDPESWWMSVVDAVHQLGDARARAVAVGLSVHSPVLVPLDSDGRAITPGYRFDAPQLPGLVSAASTAISSAAHDRLANPFTPATAIVVAERLFRSEHEDRVAQLRWLGSVGSVLGHRFTGRIAIDPSQASYYGCFDVVSGTGWLQGAVEALGIDPDVLPPVRPAGSALGSLLEASADLLGLPAGISVTVAGGDTPCAALAVGLDADTDTLLTLGTTHVVTRWLGEPDRTNRRLLQRSHVVEDTWLAHGATNGGLALAAGAELAGNSGPNSVSTTVAAAASLDLSEIAAAPFYLPHVIPERGPLWMSEPASGLLGLGKDETADSRSVALAVVEGVLFADRLVLEQVARGAEVVHVATDLSNGTDFVQLAADLLNREIVVVGESHLSAFGAACLAASGFGVTLPNTVAGTTFSPRAERADVIESRWREWRAARARTLGL